MAEIPSASGACHGVRMTTASGKYNPVTTTLHRVPAIRIRARPNEMMQTAITRLAMFLVLMLITSIAWATPRFSVANEFGRDGSGASRLDNPWRMAVDPENGDIAVADAAKHRIVIYGRDGGFKTSFGIAGSQPGQLQAPCAVAFLADGLILVSDTGNNRLQIFDRSGRFIRAFGGPGHAEGQFTKPTGVAIAPTGEVFVADSGNNRIQVFSLAGAHLRNFGTQGKETGQFELPYDVAIHPDGNEIAVADYGNHRVQVFDTRGRFLRQLGGFGTGPEKFWGAAGIAYTRDGTLLVADAANRRVQWFDRRLGEHGEFGGPGDSPGRFVQAHAVTADWRDGTIYVSDFYLNRVQAFRDAHVQPSQPRQYKRLLPAAGAGIAVLLAGIWLLRRRHVRHLPLDGEARMFQRARLRPRRPAVPAEWILLATSIVIALLLNRTFWNTIAISSTGEPLLSGIWLIPAALLLTAAQLALLVLLTPRILVKPVVLLLVLLAAAIDFYMRRYHIYLDVTMMQNVLGTDRMEAKQQITRSALSHVAVWGAGTVLALSWLRVRNDGLRTNLVRRFRYLAFALVAIALCLSATHGRLQKVFDDKPEAFLLLNPASALVNLPRAYFSGALPTGDAPAPIGLDAKRYGKAGLPRLFVLVIGESTRGASWGLNGHARDTTPELRRIGVVNFPDVTSCGSNTLTSVPCMLSPWGRRQYDATRIQRSEGLLHILMRAGYQVDWIENSGTCLGVCRGVPSRTVQDHVRPCQADGCLDGLLIDALKTAVAEDGTRRDRVIVLHMAGSHGPSYHSRYPREFARFQPECLSDDVRGCDSRATLNSYENSVLYTDHVLSRLIGVLQGRSDYATALLYTSDHGESLGENGIYMHGTPYPIAPREQLHVPMVFWASPDFMRERGIESRCMPAQARRPTTHDSVFHSTLNLLRISTSLYDRSVDWFANCTKNAFADK